MNAAAYRALLDSRRRFLQGIVTRHHKAPEPPGLFHFTSGPVLCSIIANNQLRLYDLRGMSDHTELWRPGRIARAVAEADEKLGHPRYAALRDAVLGQLNAYDEFASAFGTCFTVLGDEPGQWHLYGHNGDGYVMELHPHSLLDGVLQWANRTSGIIGMLDRVSYDAAAQTSIIRETIHEVLDCYDRGRMETTPADRPWLIQRTTAYLVSALAGPIANSKAPRYAREQEQRLIRSLPQSHSQWNSIIKEERGRRFVEERPWPKRGRFAARLPLVSVRYGPLVDPMVAEALVREACAEAGAPVPLILPSAHSAEACARHLADPCECAKTKRAVLPRKASGHSELSPSPSQV